MTHTPTQAEIEAAAKALCLARKPNHPSFADNKKWWDTFGGKPEYLRLARIALAAAAKAHQDPLGIGDAEDQIELRTASEIEGERLARKRATTSASPRVSQNSGQANACDQDEGA